MVVIETVAAWTLLKPGVEGRGGLVRWLGGLNGFRSGFLLPRPVFQPDLAALDHDEGAGRGLGPGAAVHVADAVVLGRRAPGGCDRR